MFYALPIFSNIFILGFPYLYPLHNLFLHCHSLFSSFSLFYDLLSKFPPLRLFHIYDILILSISIFFVFTILSYLYIFLIFLFTSYLFPYLYILFSIFYPVYSLFPLNIFLSPSHPLSLAPSLPRTLSPSPPLSPLPLSPSLPSPSPPLSLPLSPSFPLSLSPSFPLSLSPQTWYQCYRIWISVVPPRRWGCSKSKLLLASKVVWRDL